MPSAIVHAFAGEAAVASYDGFWQSAISAQDLPSTLSLERWAIHSHYSPTVSPGKMYVRHAALLPDPAAFDAAAFRYAWQSCMWSPASPGRLAAIWNALPG